MTTETIVLGAGIVGVSVALHLQERGHSVVLIDRSAPGGFVAQSIETMQNADALWIGIAPEGTRKKVDQWKSGFWKLAKGADVPVVLEYFHYPDKIIGIGPTIEMSDDMEADMAKIREWYAPWQGKNHGTT